MSDEHALDKLKNKIDEAKKTLKTVGFKKDSSSGFVGNFINIGIELISGVFIGVGAGLFIDWAFGSSPWGLIIMFALGSAAGMLNIYKTLKQDSRTKKNSDG